MIYTTMKFIGRIECLYQRICLPQFLVHVCMYAKLLSRVRLFATPWTVACQAPPSTGFSSQEYWSGLPYSPGDLPDPGIEPESLAFPALAGRFFTTNAT